MEQSYDYVIVGGGSAGCVLANRLSEDPACRVLLLEAGKSASTPLVQLAFGFAYMLGNPRYDWRFEVGPEPGLGGRLMPYPRGRIIGGSSSINAMLYVRGFKRDYDAWAAEGLPGWDWEGVEPYLRKMECFGADSPFPRGHDGPIKVSVSPNFHPISGHILEGAAQSSVGRTADYNGPEPSGIGKAQIFYHDGRRCGSAAAYLRPAERRRNLRVLTSCTAQKILFSGLQATGVRYEHNGRMEEVRAREVILCAGAVGSPQLLELSGIGNPECLERAGITPVHALHNVGEQLQDHFLVFIVQALHGIRGLGAELSGWRAWLNGASYLLFKRGFLNGTPTQINGHADVMVDGASVGLQFMGTPLSFIYDNKRRTIVRNPMPALMLGLNVCRPNSRGHLHIRTNSIKDKPVIVMNFMTDERDVKATVAGLKLCRQIIAQPALDDIRAAETAPGAAVLDDAGLTAYARAAGASAYHPVGTCRMATRADQGVVDASLKVHGIARLRIVDASVMPRITSANTHAPTVMIAEKAADIIRAERSP